MNRRTLLSALPAVAVAPGAALAEAEASIASMYREIIRQRDIGNDPNVSDEMSDAALNRMAHLADAIVDLPARNLGEMMLKFLGHTINGDHGTDECPDSDRLWAEARSLLGSQV